MADNRELIIIIPAFNEEAAIVGVIQGIQQAMPGVPVLVLDGSKSDAWMHAGMQALADILPNPQRRTLAGQDHGAAPEVLAPALVEFFLG